MSSRQGSRNLQWKSGRRARPFIGHTKRTPIRYRPLCFEQLESKLPLATFVVSTTADVGAGTLRQALLDANAAAGLDEIHFQISSTDVRHFYYANDGIPNQVTPGNVVLTAESDDADIADIDPDWPHSWYSILPATVLPAVAEPVVIDGLTQDSATANSADLGSNTVLRVEVSGAAAPSGTEHGLRLNGGGSTLRGLVINRFPGQGLLLNGGGGNVLEGNVLGLDPSGTVLARNGLESLAIVNSPGNRIGGAAPSQRNVISGSGTHGVLIVGAPSSGNQILGNIIGLGANGQQQVSDGSGYGPNKSSGVYIDGAPNNLIGGSTDRPGTGAGNVIADHFGDDIHVKNAAGTSISGNIVGLAVDGIQPRGARAGVVVESASGTLIGGPAPAQRNIISGHTRFPLSPGIEITGGSANVVQGNYIGTDITGTVARPNNFAIVIGGGASGTVIGGLAVVPGVAPGNVISGNASGISISGLSQGSRLQGNLVGTDATGTHALGNVTAGISISDGASNSLIGGDETGARNVISANREGVVLASGANITANNVIRGNYIGTDISGQLDLGNSLDGIRLNGSSDNLIAGNVISGNGPNTPGFLAPGIVLQNLANNNTIEDNFIGAAADGNSPLGNTTAGIRLASVNNTLVRRNTIAFNGSDPRDDGVQIDGFCAGNTIRENAIFANAGLGIDLGNEVGVGVTPNDALDADNGANRLQNYPVLDSAARSLNSLRVSGTLASVPDSDYRIEFFGNNEVDLSGYGEGRWYLGAAGITTDATGLASFTADLSVTVSDTGWITATATDLSGNTSEFSLAVMSKNEELNGADLEVTIVDTPDPVYLGESVTYTITVTNHGPLDATEVVVTATTPDQELNTVIVPWGSVPAGQSRAFQFTWKANKLGSVTTTAIVSAAQEDPSLTNNRLTEMTEVLWPGKVVVVNTLDSGPGSLRQAILDANAHPGQDTIEFQLPGPDYTISPLTPLPTITEAVVIDGYTQPGARSNTRADGNDAVLIVELSGTNLASQDSNNLSVGLDVSQTQDAAIRGLVINLFVVGIHIGGIHNTIEGNYFGTDTTGTLGKPNNIGVLVTGAYNLIGGPSPQSRNVISGNGKPLRVPNGGVVLQGLNNTVAGNLIGTNASGNQPLPNSVGILVLEGDKNTIGGATSTPGIAPGNLISGNAGPGVWLYSDHFQEGIPEVVRETMIVGNLIGTDLTGRSPLGNSSGIKVQGASGTIIGGGQANTGNVISGNGWGVQLQGDCDTICANLNDQTKVEGNLIGMEEGGDGRMPNAYGGIVDEAPRGLRVLSNDFFSSPALPIQLGPSGQRQEAPVVTRAESDGLQTVVAVTLQGAPNQKFLIQFFQGEIPGAGGAYVASLTLFTDTTGLASFEHVIDLGVSSTTYLSATATRVDGDRLNTSEFSAPVAVAYPGQPVFQFRVAAYQTEEGAGALLVTVERTGGLESSVTVDFSTVDGTATAGADYAAARGTLTFAANEIHKTIEIPILGDSRIEGNETFEITLSHPVGGRLGDQAIALVTILDAVSQIQFSAPRFEVREGEKEAVVTVKRTGAFNSGSATVDFMTLDGTAVQPGILAGNGRRDDFSTTSGTLYFRPLQTMATIRVPIRDDAILEPDESFQVVLSNPSLGAELGMIAAADVIIHDNDPTVRFVVGTTEIGEGVPKRIPLEVRLQPASNQVVAVSYNAERGDAELGADFTLSGSITFQPGETRTYLYLTVANDSIYEGDETAIIELSSATNAFLGNQTTYRLKIHDDDPQPPPVEPGATPDTAVFIDLQTLPRQSIRDTLFSGDTDTFRVHLHAGERLMLDVDPEILKSGAQTQFQGLTTSTLVIYAPDKVTQLTSVGASGEPDTGTRSNNPATMFQADEEGDYYVQLQTATNSERGYRLFFHRIGVAEHVPAPELLNVPGEMFVWFDGVNTVGITGPTGYGFTLEGPWQQRSVTTARSGLTSQTLTLATGSQFTLRSPQGVAVPLLANDTITISSAAQRWGDIVGVVTAPAIDFPVSLSIAPINDLLSEVFGSQMLALGLLNGQWRISLGGRVLATEKGDTSSAIDTLLVGVPYLRQKGPIKVAAQLGSVVIDYRLTEKPVDWAFDPADPMLYLRGEELGNVKRPVLAISRHGLLEYKPQDAPSPQVSSGVTEFYGHVFASAAIPFQAGPLPMEVNAEAVINLDANRDGLFLGDLRDVDEVFGVLGGDLSEVREVMNDIQFGANGELKFVPGFFNWELELGRASIVLNGLEETIWVQGQQGGTNPLAGTPLVALNTASSIELEGMIDWSGDFFLSTTTSYSLAGIELEYNITLTNEGIFAKVIGRVEWSVNIDYGVGSVSGKAIAKIEGDLAIAIGDDGDIIISGSVSASGTLKYKKKTIFSGTIQSSVRKKGLRFKFPNGVGAIDLDLFS